MNWFKTRKLETTAAIVVGSLSVLYSDVSGLGAVLTVAIGALFGGLLVRTARGIWRSVS